MSWTFRPSALQTKCYSKLTIDELISHYIKDNERANREGVMVPLPPSSVSKLRTIQWNIHNWMTSRDERNDTITRGIADSIFEGKPDVIVLNEYIWIDRRGNGRKQATRVSPQKLFQQELRRQGYAFYCGKNKRTQAVDSPTFIATTKVVRHYLEIPLSIDRSALCVQIDTEDDNGLWIIGTHLDAWDGDKRKQEMTKLLKYIQDHNGMFHPQGPVIIVGDFNQQRSSDYLPGEWGEVMKSLNQRKVCHNDGVSNLLRNHYFACVFDRPKNDQKNRKNAKTYMNTAVQCNWGKKERPPSTHWSGTIVDYSYSRNVPVHGIYVHPSGFSDHRMTVCDWDLPSSATSKKQRSQIN